MNPTAPAPLRRYPLTSYFLLTYAVTWSLIAWIVGIDGLRSGMRDMGQLGLVFLAMLAGPSLTGVILTAAIDGRQGVRALFTGMTRWRVGARWWAVALLTTAAVTLAVLTTLTILVSPIYRPGFNPAGLVIGLAAGIFEEIGWTGFALPRLRTQHGPLAAGLVLGIIWGIWHLLSDYVGTVASMGPLWLNYFIVFVISVTAYRVLMAWVYEHTRSLLLMQLMHAAYTGSLYALSPAVSTSETILFSAIIAAVLWVLVAGLAVINWNN